MDNKAQATEEHRLYEWGGKTAFVDATAGGWRRCKWNWISAGIFCAEAGVSKRR